MTGKTLDTEQNAFKMRVKELVDNVGGVSRFANITGIKRPSAKKYMEGTDPSRAALTKIVTNLDVDPFWLLTGREAPAPRESVKILTPQEAAPKEESNALEVPVFSYREYKKHLLKKFDFEDRNGAIKSLLEKRKDLPSRSFDKSFIESSFLSGHESIMCHRMDDHTMFPDIPEGAIMLLDLSKTKVSPGRTYLFRYDDEPIVRRALENEDSTGWILAGERKEATIKISKQEMNAAGCAIAQVTHVFKSI